MNTWLTSDWHIGHANIIRLCNRPFADVYQMNEALISNYQSVVTDEDIVYFIGDICWSYQDLPKLLSRLPGHKRLIVGNHEGGLFKEVWKLSNTNKFYKFYLDAGFESIDTSLVIEIAGQQVNLNHFPYRVYNPEPEYDDRYRTMRPENDGKWLIHGHIHNKGLMKDRMINVSVEMWDYKPVSIKTIQEIIESNGTILAYPGWSELNVAILAGEYGGEI